MNKEEILKEIRVIKVKLMNVDCMRNDHKAASQKIVNEVFNDLEQLERKINV